MLKYHIEIKSRSSYIATRGYKNKYFRKYSSLMRLVKHVKIFIARSKLLKEILKCTGCGNFGIFKHGISCEGVFSF